MIVIPVILFGLLIGSFLNVVIYRVPRRESIVLPASRCPDCGHELSWRDNIPLVSYLLQKGKCCYCSGPISAQYPLVEGGTALILAVAWLTSANITAFLLAAAFLLVLWTVSIIDIHHKIIPNVIIIPGVIIAALVVLGLPFVGVPDLSLLGGGPRNALIGFVIGGGLLLLLAVLWPNGMGGGDIKLAGFMGLFLGPYVIIALFLGFLFGAVGGLVAMGLLGKDRKDQIPFGPYLAAGAALTLYFGLPTAAWYLGISGLG